MTGTDMSTPVTRGELREELGLLRQEFRSSLEIWGGALLARIEQSEHRMLERFSASDRRFNAFEQRVDERFRESEQRMAERMDERMDERFRESEQRMSCELARHVKAVQESMQVQVSAFDEKYADLPGRVSQIEAIVLAPR